MSSILFLSICLSFDDLYLFSQFSYISHLNLLALPTPLWEREKEREREEKEERERGRDREEKEEREKEREE